MIPIEITLRNFLSYGPEETVVDFSGMNLVCICGSNGAGKSALLDAMLWALYNTSRMGSRSHRELIRRGASDTAVSFTFELEGECYRIDRKARISASGKIGDVSISHVLPGGELTPIAKGNEAENAINNLMRLNADGFMASTFLSQGKSGFFSTVDPAQRKAILAEILELQYYEKLASVAGDEARKQKIVGEERERLTVGESELKEQLRTIKESLAVAELLIAKQEKAAEHLQNELGKVEKDKSQILNTISNLDSLHAQITLINKSLEQEEQNRKLLQERLIHAESAKARLPVLQQQNETLQMLLSEASLWQKRKEETVSLQSELLRLDAELARQESELKQSLTRLDSDLARNTEKKVKLASIIEQKEQIEEGFSRLGKTWLELERLNKLSEQYESDRTELDRLRMEIEKEKQVLEQSTSNLETLLAEKMTIIAQLPTMKREYKELQTKNLHYQKLKEELLKLNKALQESKNIRGYLETEWRTNKEMLQKLEENKITLSNADQDCPLCRQSLDEESRSAVLAQYGDEEQALLKRQSAIESEGKELNEQLAATTNLIESAEKELKELEGVEARRLALASRMEEVQRLITESTALQGQLDALKAKLNTRDYAQVSRKLHDELLDKTHAVELELKKKAPLEKQIKELSIFEARHEELLNALHDIAEIESLLGALVEQRRFLWEQLEKGEWRLSHNAGIERINNRLEEIAYDTQKHTEVLAAMEPLSGVSILLATTENLARTEGELKIGIESCDARMTDYRARIAYIAEQLAGEDTYRQQLGIVLERQQALQMQLNELQMKMQQEKQKLGGLLQALDSTDKELEKKRQADEESRSAYRKSRVAAQVERIFGSNGIPSMITASILPQISTLATEILRLLSNDNLATIEFRTKKATVKGNFKDSLDIIIADRNGERDYHLFSGGESFRIDIALRVALAQLLARRAGVSIRTLIIDEGFGTQDMEGIDRLSSIMDRLRGAEYPGGLFDLIILVTHVEELKNRFEQQLLVEKDINGYSTVSKVF